MSAWAGESGDAVTPASARTGFHPGPASLTSLKNVTSVSRLVCGPRNVTLTQTTVVVATVAISEM
jgi:hypothetical protein